MRVMVDKDTLYRMYIVEQKNMHQIAKELGIASGTVCNYAKKYGIKARTLKENTELNISRGWKFPEDVAKKRGLAMRGKKLSDETKRKISEKHKKGGIGYKKTRTDGYVYIHFPDHPQATKDGMIMEHILVMECLIGRHLKDDEVVHHINKIRNDNRKENLKLMTKSEHMSFHSKLRWEDKRKVE